MANWQGAFRTNYFKVKDEAAFKDWVHSLISEETPNILRDSEGRYGLGAYDAIPYTRSLTDEELQQYAEKDAQEGDTLNDMEMDFDFATELAQHLQDGEIAIVQEVGYEKLRYLTGVGYAVNHKGEIIQQSDINFKLPDGLTATEPMY